MKRIISMLGKLLYAQGILALTGILRNKVLAYNLHPLGFGAFNRIFATTSLFYMAATFGLSACISRNVAATEDPEERREILRVANFITLVLSGAAFLICFLIVLSGKANGLFGLGPDPSYAWMLLVLVGLTLAEVWRNNFYSVLQGLADVKGIGPERAYSVLAMSVVTLPLVFFFGLWGAVVQTGLVTVFQTVVHGHRVKVLNFRPIQFRWRLPVAKQLFGVGITALVFFICDKLTDNLVGIRLELATGLKQIGFLACALSLSGQLKSIMATSVATYAIANVSKEKTEEGQSKAVGDILTVLVPATTYMMVLLTAFSPLLIGILFTKEFAISSKLVGLIVAADFAANASYIFITPMLAQNKLKAWLTIDLVLLFNRTWITLVLIRPLGIFAYPIGGLASMLIHFCTVVWGYHHITKLKVAPKLLLRVLLGLILLLLAAYLVQLDGLLPKGLLVLSILALFALDVKQFDLVVRIKEMLASRKGLAGS